MKKIVTLVLVLAISLSLCACGKSDTCPYDCEQCAEYEKQAQAAETKVPADATSDSETEEQNDNVIEFETPIVVAEDENIRVEAVKFYQEYTAWTQTGHPSSIKADATTEGATLEKYVVFRFCNKTDHTLTTYMDDIYLGSDGAYNWNAHSSKEIAAGKNIMREFIIQTSEKKALESMEELYSLDGEFHVSHKGEDDVLRNGYTLNFSIPNGLNASKEAPASEATPLEQDSSDERVEEVIELIDEIVLEDIVVSDNVKESLNKIYTKYNALTDEEREKVSNYETLNKAKDTYNEMWVKSLIKIEKAPLYINNYTGELELDIIWVNNSPKTIKYVYFTAGVKNSVGDYFTKNGQKLAIYQQIGPFETNYRKPNDGAYWPTGLYANRDEVGGAVITEIEIIYMDGSSAKIKENEIRFAFSK